VSEEKSLAKSVEERVKPPAIGLLVLGLIIAFNALLSLALSGLDHDANRWALQMIERSGAPVPPFFHTLLGQGALVFGVLQNALKAAIGGFLIYAAFEMLKLKSHGVCMVASVLAIVPCLVCCVIGLPIGIWSLIELNRPDVRAAFDSKA
jgi:ABC-type proline/glycine betaine transport system permease subunit